MPVMLVMALAMSLIGISGLVAAQGGEARTITWLVRTGYGETEWQDTVVVPMWAEAHPDIELNMIRLSQEEGYIQREAMIAAGEPLHVWSPNWGGGGFASDRVRGLLMDLTPLIEANDYDLSDFSPGLLAAYQTPDGAQWGMPFLSAGSYLFWNKDLFDAAGIDYPTTDWDDPDWTWDAFLELAHDLTANYDDPNNTVYGAVAFAELLETPARLWGQGVWPEEAWATGFADSVTVTDDRAVEAYQSFHDLAFVENVAPDPAATEALNALGGTFASGRVAMQIQGGWGIWVYKGLLDDPNGFCWGIAPLPAGREDAVERAVLWTDPWVITAGLSEEDTAVAWEFVQFLLSPEQMRLFSEVNGTPPVRLSILQEYYENWGECQPVEDFQTVFEGAYTHGHESSNHLIVRWDELWQTWSNYLDPFWADAAGDAAEVLAIVEEEVNAGLQLINEEMNE
jgi:multiple sugar transport system substrate-binding protein